MNTKISLQLIALCSCSLLSLCAAAAQGMDTAGSVCSAAPMCATNGLDTTYYFETECHFEAYNRKLIESKRYALERQCMEQCYNDCELIDCPAVYAPICGVSLEHSVPITFQNSCELGRQICNTRCGVWRVIGKGACQTKTECQICAIQGAKQRTFGNLLEFLNELSISGQNWTISHTGACQNSQHSKTSNNANFRSQPHYQPAYQAYLYNGQRRPTAKMNDETDELESSGELAYNNFKQLPFETNTAQRNGAAAYYMFKKPYNKTISCIFTENPKLSVEVLTTRTFEEFPKSAAESAESAEHVEYAELRALVAAASLPDDSSMEMPSTTTTAATDTTEVKTVLKDATTEQGTINAYVTNVNMRTLLRVSVPITSNNSNNNNLTEMSTITHIDLTEETTVSNILQEFATLPENVTDEINMKKSEQINIESKSTTTEPCVTALTKLPIIDGGIQYARMFFAYAQETLQLAYDPSRSLLPLNNQTMQANATTIDSRPN